MEEADAAVINPGDVVTFVNWGNIKIEDVKKSELGELLQIVAHLDLDNKALFKTIIFFNWTKNVPF